MIAPRPDHSACIEMLFTEAPDPADRIRRAAMAGYGAVEFWLWSNKDHAALSAALAETGMQVAGFVAEPMVSLNDPANHAGFLAALPASIAMARRFGAPFLYVQGGSLRPGVPRDRQSADLAQGLTAAADILHGSGVTLLLEPVSDADNGFLTHAGHGLDIVAGVNRAEVRLLLDIFHSAVADEDWRAAVAGRIPLIAHVHLADHPGRGAPGSGTLDLGADMDWLRARGYAGRFGFEFVPCPPEPEPPA